jgi:hypothetical protein
MSDKIARVTPREIAEMILNEQAYADTLFVLAAQHDAEIASLRARVEVLETIRAAAQALIDYEDSNTYDPAGKGWEHFEENLRAALEAKP